MLLDDAVSKLEVVILHHSVSEPYLNPAVTVTMDRPCAAGVAVTSVALSDVFARLGGVSTTSVRTEDLNVRATASAYAGYEVIATVAIPVALQRIDVTRPTAVRHEAVAAGRAVAAVDIGFSGAWIYSSYGRK